MYLLTDVLEFLLNVSQSINFDVTVRSLHHNYTVHQKVSCLIIIIYISWPSSLSLHPAKWSCSGTKCLKLHREGFTKDVLGQINSGWITHIQQWNPSRQDWVACSIHYHLPHTTALHTAIVINQDQWPSLSITLCHHHSGSTKDLFQLIQQLYFCSWFGGVFDNVIRYNFFFALMPLTHVPLIDIHSTGHYIQH